MESLIGKRVMNRRTKATGIITDINDGIVYVSDGFDKWKYAYPAAFADTLVLEDEEIQDGLRVQSFDAKFEKFRKLYAAAIYKEINYLKTSGGKRYRIVDGERVSVTKNESYIYAFDTDSELHFPDGTAIKLWLKEEIVYANVISCEEFTIIFQTAVDLGEKVETLEFTAEPWQLIESLIERLYELDEESSPIAYQLACTGMNQIDYRKSITLGQNQVQRMSGEQPITFVWGPPGTGKTTTLVNVALQFLSQGKRVLMLSYSNVSVDGALWRMASHFDNPGGMIVRYGYPRMKDVLDSKILTSYAYIIHTHPEIEKEYEALKKEKKSLNKKDSRRGEIDKKLKRIRTEFKEQEQELIQRAPFVATTVSKAVVDRAVYSQSFDLVIFDEASMAYVPQVVFSASLAKESFLCLGDFKQLPAIVQNPEDTVLRKDIFDFTGIRKAVANGYGHNWLVMLDKQYRMHPEIAEFVGDRMYEGLLWSESSVFGRRQPVSDIVPLQRRPMGMIDLSGSYSVCIKTNDGSRINLLSAMICIRLAEMMHNQYEVGIITPYSAQSRLILAMIRDLQEVDSQYETMSSATVHQFQGSEKPIIIYDAVDCFRMPYPGVLLTAKRDGIANRLFNVALTRTQGKFILVVNKDYMFQKKIAKDLLFTQLMNEMTSKEDVVSGEELLYEIGTTKEDPAKVFFGERDEVESWDYYLKDIQKAQDSIVIEIPGPMDDDEDAVDSLIEELKNAESRQVKINIRVGDNVSVPQEIQKYCQPYMYVTTPFTIIDSRIIWFGEPLCAADFMSEGNVVLTEFFPCLRFEGKYTARIIKAFYGISSHGKKDQA